MNLSFQIENVEVYSDKGSFEMGNNVSRSRDRE
jgi:hypothetical protein